MVNKMNSPSKIAETNLSDDSFRNSPININIDELK